MPTLERVLVIAREHVPGGCDFTGVRPAAYATIDELRDAIASYGRFLERPTAESDPAFKQLVPYVVVRSGKLVFLMERSDGGGDARLHRKASIGVGGHLNPIDGKGDPLSAGLRREWAEELTTDWEPQFRPIGVLNDDSNAVGSVHLGVVFEVDAAGRQLSVREHEKLSGRWADADALRAVADRLETWSRLVGEYLGLLPVAVQSPIP